jgi:ADP-ribose pyrophosphatase
MKIVYEKNDVKIIENDYGRVFFQEDQRDSVVLLAKKENDFILIRQFRQPVAEYVVQLPGGGMELGESLETAARREFFEETGYKCGKVVYLGKMVPASWRSNEVTHVFYSEEVMPPSAQQLESHEKIEVLHMEVEECLKAAQNNQLTDSELCFAILQLLLKGYIEKKELT